MSDVETFTEAELRESMARIRFVAPKILSEQIVADIIAHREPEYEVGEIYQDARGRKLMRRSDALWPWLVLNQDEYGCPTMVDSFAVRPLRKLVPVHEKGSYDDGFLHGFTAGQEASDVG